MDRQTVYSGQVVRTVDTLQQSQNAMVALAKLSSAVLGSTSILNAFTCTPTTPASLNVLITPGEIYQMENLEQSNWSLLNQDTAHSILKQGLLLDVATLGITPPSTTGFSQCFLIEVQYQDTDAGSTLLPYFNAAQPSVPYSGPGNSGTAQNTVRKGVAAVQIKAGIAASTGTQTIPSPDVGWVGAFVVTVANGAGTITSGNIATYTNSPFIPVTLPNVPATAQSGAWTYGGATTNAASAYSAALNPVPAALTTGMIISLKMNAAPVGASTLTINDGSGSHPLVGRGGRNIVASDWNANDFISWEWTGTSWMACSLLQGDIGGGVPLHVNVNWYVNGTTGSDTLYDGTSSAVSGTHGPFATIQRALTECQKYNLNGFSMTVNVADGSYTGPITLPQVNGSGSVILAGNNANPQNVQITSNQNLANTIFLGSSCFYQLSGFRIANIHSGGFDGIAVNSGQLSVSNMQFARCTRYHISGGRAGTLTVSGPITIEAGANASAHIAANINGAIAISSDSTQWPSLNILGAVSFSDSFAHADTGGTLQLKYTSITGASNVTGQKYVATSNATITTFGNGASYYPGSAAGVTATGGQFLG